MNMPNISDGDLEKISARKNFKGEDDFDTLEAAELAAKARSMSNRRVVYVDQDGKRYWVHSHGVAIIGRINVCKYQNGTKI